MLNVILIILLFFVLLILIQQILQKAIIGQKKKYSIGIYSGDNLFNLNDKEFKNPLLTKFDVTDVRASFVADPFIVKDSNKYYLFMEVKSKRKRDIGEIGVAVGDSLKNLKYQKIVLKENFHLSYPYVVKENGNFYMIPESGENRDLRVYKANDFPYDWKLEKIIFENKRLADPTLVYYNNKWWLFITNMENNSLEIYYASSLMDNFTPHKKNPVYVNDKSKNRNGGRIFIDDGKMYRFTQNCENYYGEKVDMYEIIKLNENEFEEKFIKTILEPSKNGWNSNQMHNIDILKENNKYYAIVDGGSFEKENYYEINKFLRKFL